MLIGFISVIHTKDRMTKNGRMDHSEPCRQKVCNMDCLWSGPGERLLEELIRGWKRKVGWTGLGELRHEGKVAGRPREEEKGVVHASQQGTSSVPSGTTQDTHSSYLPEQGGWLQFHKTGHRESVSINHADIAIRISFLVSSLNSFLLKIFLTIGS